MKENLSERFDKLSPQIIQQKLPTKFIAKEIHYFQEIDSTQDVAFSLAKNGSAEGTLVISESQQVGRGRFKRKWFSAKGGLYFSLILRPESIPTSKISQITLLAGRGVTEAIKKSSKIRCFLKWPNDIFLGDKKLGGILCEAQSRGSKVDFVILGIGININTKDLPQGATSLFLFAKKKFNRARILKAILKELETLYQK